MEIFAIDEGFDEYIDALEQHIYHEEAQGFFEELQILEELDAILQQEDEFNFPVTATGPCCPCPK